MTTPTRPRRTPKVIPPPTTDQPPARVPWYQSKKFLSLVVGVLPIAFSMVTGELDTRIGAATIMPMVMAYLAAEWGVDVARTNGDK